MAKTMTTSVNGNTKAVTSGATAGVVAAGDIQIVFGSNVYQTGLYTHMLQEAVDRIIEKAKLAGEAEDV